MCTDIVLKTGCRTGRKAGHICEYEGCDNEAWVQPSNGYIHKHCKRCQRNMEKYGITTPQRDAMAEEQGWKCKVCDAPITFQGNRGGRSAAAVDHCHTRGHIRGILCHQCNKGLGMFEDNIMHLWRALRYLEEDDDKFFEEGL